jgi:hypothetical protein
MYLRCNTKKKGGTDYDSWLLVESVRAFRGPRQRATATIGKLPGLGREERIGWDEISRILSGKQRASVKTVKGAGKDKEDFSRRGACERLISKAPSRAVT